MIDKFVFLDTETTGLGDEDKVIQLAYIYIGGGKTVPLERKYDPKMKISFKAMSVHHITQEEVDGKKELDMDDKLMKGLNKINDNTAALFAHNASFDIGMIEKAGFKCAMNVVDTARCARHLYEDVEGYDLGTLFYQLGLYKKMDTIAHEMNIDISKLSSHDAMYDVLMLILLSRDLIKKVGNQVAKLIELTGTPVEIKVFAFGKYKGSVIKDVAVSDKGYLKWMLGNMDLNEDMTYTITKALEEN